MASSAVKEVQPVSWTQWALSIWIFITDWVTSSKVTLRSMWRNSWCKSSARLDGKTVIVTGCNTGIGKETCRDLLKRGARIIMACRNLDKAKVAADDIRQSEKDIIIIKHLDLTSLKSVRKFAAEILAEEPKIHILINNAGVMAHPQDKTEDGFEMHIGVNHIGPFLLTCLLLDRLKESAPSRIINVSSLAHVVGRMNFDDINCTENYNPFTAYAQSKLANVLFTRSLTKRLHGSGVTTYVLHPGVVNTELGRTLTDVLNVYIARLCLWLAGFFADSPTKGAQTTIYCAVEQSIENTSGKYYSDCREEDPAIHAKSDADAERLWEMTKEMVKLDA